MVNSFYTIISKILALRLASLLPLVNIDESQFDFVKGRSIIENFLSAHELIAHCKRNKQRVPCKLDFENAFHKIN